MNLGQFIDTFREAIAQRVVESFPPLYRPSENGGKMPRLLRKPLGAQADAIRGAALSLEAHRGTTVVGEMGTGKTFIAAAAAHMAGFKRVLVLCPPHLVPKWKREVEMTVPGARAVIVKSITDLERLRISVGSGPLFAVVSREKAKLSYRWMPAVIQRWAVSKGRLLRDEETGEPFRVPCCPDCTAQIVDKDGVPLTDADLNRRKHTCAGCGGPLWQADKSGPARYPLADYVKHRMKGFFDLLVGDEVHEYKGRGSAQGIAAGVLADVCGKSLSLSGTLMGGYSSTLFHLLYRFSPDLRTDFERSDEHRWIQRYGFEEVTVGKPDDDAVEDGRNSRRRSYRKVVRERPGLVPSALFHIIGNTVFLRLADVASGLPDYDEQILLSSMDSEEDATGYSQRSAYNTVYEELRLKLAEALKAGSKRLLATYLQTLLAYPEGCTKGETVFDPRSGDVIVQVPPFRKTSCTRRRRPWWTWWRRSGSRPVKWCKSASSCCCCLGGCRLREIGLRKSFVEGQNGGCEVSTSDDPFVVLLSQDGANEAAHGRPVREDAHHIGASPDLLVETLLWVVGPELLPVGEWEAGEGQDVGSRFVQ